MKYVSNINSLSALFDRLIVERIKWFFFQKNNESYKENAQLEIIGTIKEMIKDLIIDTLKDREYNVLSENRTFIVDDFISAAENLVLNNLHIGEADRARLSEVKSDAPDYYKLIFNELRLRVSNENRSLNKNNIDSTYGKIIS
jgi:hypothetical protein